MPEQTPVPAPPAEQPRYRLGSRLGPSGQVYEAQSAIHSGPLAVKLFPFAAGLPAAAVAAFTDEAARVADLRHPHIVQVLRAGTFADGTPFTAAERLFGQTLEESIAGRGPLSPDEVLPILRGIASALAAAHAVGVVHRELRADNVFIASLAGYETGFVKVLDFGVSQLTAAARAAGRIVAPATIGVLPPEQRQRSLLSGDERADQFSMAALTYRLLTGGEVTPGMQRGPAFERMRDNQLASRAAYVRCPPDVEAVLATAMSQQPENRFDSITAFFRALQEVLSRVAAGSMNAGNHAGGGGGPALRSAMGAMGAMGAMAAMAAPPVRGDEPTVPKVAVGGPGDLDPMPAYGRVAPNELARTQVGHSNYIKTREAGAPAAPVMPESAPTVRLKVAPGMPGTTAAPRSPGTPAADAAGSRAAPLAAVRDALPEGGPSTAGQPRTKTVPINPPVLADGSLTQQFFVEGERHEADRWANSPVMEEDFVDARPSKREQFDSFDALPKRRTPFVVAGACLLAAVALIAWAVGRSSDALPSTTTAAPAVAPQAPPNAGPAPAVPPHPSAPAVTSPAAAAASPTGEAARGTAASEPAPERLPAQTSRGVPGAGAHPPTRGAVPPAPVNRAAGPAGPAAGAPRTPAPATAAVPAAQSPGAAQPESAAPRGPLRGYVWSENRRKLTRSRPAPVPTDSGPPPRFSPDLPPSAARDLLPPAP